jgi:hypothetical protein
MTAMLLALTDHQLHRVMAVAQTLAIEKRDTFLQRAAASGQVGGL